MPRISKPAPIAKPKSFRTTDATPKKPVKPAFPKSTGTGRGKLQSAPKAPMVKGKTFKATSKSTPVMPSSTKKLGKMNRGAY